MKFEKILDIKKYFKNKAKIQKIKFYNDLL